MSGIVGLYYLDGKPANGADLGRMMDLLAHRGPDGSGVWCNGAVGLGHGLLHTTPESLQEQQPLVGRAGSVVLTADARIDNRDELIGWLNLHGQPRHDLTDADLILAAYQRWGETCPSRLLGDFAFALWDGKKNRLFCARDHYGVRPFYYYQSPTAFAFASEIKALLGLPEVPRRLNEERLGEYLVPFYDDKESTFYADIFRLPPGHCISVGRETMQLRSYWSLDPAYELKLGSDEEYAEAFREIFTEAVRCRLRSAFPIGSLLSGGLDSSSIACVARDLSSPSEDQGLHTISFTFEEIPESDERRYMEAVLEQGGFTPHFVRGDQIDPFTDLNAMLWHLDEPHIAYNLFLNKTALETAQHEGLRVLLDGFLGDSTVSHGESYLAELAYSSRWITWAREVRTLCQPPGSSFQWKALWYHALQYGLYPLAPRFMQDAWLALLKRATAPSSIDSIINPDFSRRIGLSERLQARKPKQVGASRSARAVHYQDLSSGAYPLALEALNKVAAAFSTEVRLPFTDKRLMEFCLAIPPNQKFSAGWSRSILRRGLAGRLPEKVRWRRDKGNVGPIFKHSLLTHGRALMEDVIVRDPSAIEPYVCIATLRDAYRRFTSQRADHEAAFIWLAVTLASWLRTLEGFQEANNAVINKPPS